MLELGKMESAKGLNVTAMANFAIIGGYLYFAKSSDPASREPPHVHISKDGQNPTAKFWLYKKTSNDPQKIELAETGGFDEKHLKAFESNVRKNQFSLLNKYVAEMKKANNPTVPEVEAFIVANKPTGKSKGNGGKRKSRATAIAEKLVAYISRSAWPVEMKNYYDLAVKSIPLLCRSTPSSDSEHPNDCTFFFKPWRKQCPDLGIWLDRNGRRMIEYKVQDYSAGYGVHTGAHPRDYDELYKCVDSPAAWQAACRFINNSLQRVYSRAK